LRQIVGVLPSRAATRSIAALTAFFCAALLSNV
jgi:hypothetical protein